MLLPLMRVFVRVSSIYKFYERAGMSFFVGFQLPQEFIRMFLDMLLPACSCSFGAVFGRREGQGQVKDGGC